MSKNDSSTGAGAIVIMIIGSFIWSMLIGGYLFDSSLVVLCVFILIWLFSEAFSS